jgi:hypothetical protein
MEARRDLVIGLAPSEGWLADIHWGVDKLVFLTGENLRIYLVFRIKGEFVKKKKQGSYSSTWDSRFVNLENFH